MFIANLEDVFYFKNMSQHHFEILQIPQRIDKQVSVQYKEPSKCRPDEPRPDQTRQTQKNNNKKSPIWSLNLP